MSTPTRGVVVLLSGGLDSSTLLAQLAHQYEHVAALSVHYGQRNVRELDSARRIAEHYHVPHDVVDLRSLAGIMQGSSQTDARVEVPRGEGAYTAQNVSATVIPNRNLMLLSAAAAAAISRGWDAIAYAPLAGDRAPDCQPAFVEAAQKTFQLIHEYPVHLLTPFLTLRKSSVLSLGLSFRVPYELTWTCYEGNPLSPCRECRACQERAKAFASVGVADPLLAH